MNGNVGFGCRARSLRIKAPYREARMLYLSATNRINHRACFFA